MVNPDTGQGDPSLAAILGSLQQIPQLIANLSSLQESIAALTQGQQELTRVQQDLTQGQRDLTQELQQEHHQAIQQQKKVIQQQQRTITSIALGKHAANINNKMKPSPTPVFHQPSVQTTVSNTPNTAAPTDQAI